MIDLVNFLNQNSGAVIALATVTYMILTGCMWWEMRKSRERLDEPNIQVSLEPQARWGNFFDLIVENLGNVPVYDLELTITPKGLKTIGDRKLEDLNLFQRRIPVLGLGQKLRTFAMTYVDFINSDQPKTITFSAKYKTPNNREKTQIYSFDMEAYKGMSASFQRDIGDVVNRIEKLTKTVSKIEQKIKK